jgi:putative redox protein
MSVSMERIEFTGAGGAKLAARLDRPAAAPVAYALFAHCFTCSKDIFAAARIAQGLAAHGIATLRFDFTGLGASEGEFANTNFSSNVGDLVAAADYMRAHLAAPRILVGHSLGGAAVLAAAARIPEAAAVATIAAPSDPAHVRRLLTGSAADIERDGEAPVSLAGRTFTIKKQFLDDIAAVRLKEAIGGLRKALLVMHAPFDQVVDIDNAAEIFLAAKHPKSFVSLDKADHLLTRREDAVYAADVIAAWASRYVGSQTSPAPAAAEDGAVVVRENGVGLLSQDIVTGRHLMHADEPASAGGNDTGLTPYQLLSAALGACTSMTLRLYANHKKWPLERVGVTVRHDKIHAADCAECETKEGKVDSFAREIELTGPLDEAQRTRLLEIADKCPVHRTLHSEVQITTRLKNVA